MPLKSKKKVLLIGGAGYIGHVCADFFVKKKYQVCVLDNLIYKQKNELNKKVYFDRVNIFKLNLIQKHLDYYDNIVILSGLVGDPITGKYPNLSKKFNRDAIINILKYLRKKEKKIIFVSTCSNYGILKKGQVATEKFKLKPLSLYAKEKVTIEKFLIKNKKTLNFTILRFSTAFGLSPRMRFDLTVNQFIKEIFENKKLNVYDLDTWRPYCHVIDFARLIYLVLNKKSNLVSGEIFNVGTDSNNHTKRQILNKILKILKKKKQNIVFNKDTNDKKDMRNYKVSFQKIKTKLGFKAKHDVNFGINEILKKLRNGYFKGRNNLYGNYNIEKKFH